MWNRFVQTLKKTLNSTVCKHNCLFSRPLIVMNDSVQLFEKQLSIVTKPVPKLNNIDDVLIKIAFSGVCGTDLHILSGEFPASSKAVTLGHEFCGIVEKIGDSVKHVKVGDRVVVNPNNHCHVCQYCVDGQPNYCVAGGIRSTIGIWKNGGWAKFCRVTGSLVHKLPETIPLQKAVFVEPFSCIARGFANLGDVKPESKILICGAGIIGLLWSSLLHFKGHRNIVVTEITENRRTMAGNLNLGLKVVHPDHLTGQYREALRNKNDDWGFDVIIDCTGAPKAIEQSFSWLRRGAKFLIFGCCPKESKIELNPFDIYNKELKLVGSLINPFTFPTALALVRDMQPYLNYETLGVKKYQLHDYPAALKAMQSGMVSKAIFEVDAERD